MFVYSSNFFSLDNISNLFYLLLFIGIILYNFFSVLRKSKEQDNDNTDQDTPIEDNYILTQKETRTKTTNTKYRPNTINSTPMRTINYSKSNNSFYGKSSYSKDNPIFKSNNITLASIMPKFVIFAIISFLIIIVALSADGRFENATEVLKNAFRFINGF